MTVPGEKPDHGRNACPEMSRQDLLLIADGLCRIVERGRQPDFQAALERVESAVGIAEGAWSGSWLGYHANVYYSGLRTPPEGVRFDPEIGLSDTFTGQATSAWKEHHPESVIAGILAHAGNVDIGLARNLARDARRELETARSRALSVIGSGTPPDAVLAGFASQIASLRIPTKAETVEAFMPEEDVITRDAVAATSGICTPPHMDLLADVTAARTSLAVLDELVALLRKAGSRFCRLDG